MDRCYLPPSGEGVRSRGNVMYAKAPYTVIQRAVHIHPTTNFHVSSVDSGSVAQWMKANSPALMKAMDEAVRHGAHLGLRRLTGA